MVKVKRSFLEKLTGSRRVEPEEYEGGRGNVSNTPITNFYEEEETELITTSSPTRKNMTEENFSAGDGNEGQLTIDVYQTESDIVIKSTIAGVNINDGLLEFRA